MIKLKSIYKSRNFNYGLIGLIVVAVNLNVAYPVLAESYKAVFSHLPEQKEKFGVWDVNTKKMPVNAVHAALLKTGKVLIIAGSGNNQKDFDTNSFKSVLWNPKDNSFKTVDTPWDAFCSGHAFLPDGKLLVAGGTGSYEDLTIKPKKDYGGLKKSYIFNPETEKYDKVDSMDFARWYPTLVSLPNGDVLASSGLDEKGKIINGHTEIFDHLQGKWVKRDDLNRVFPTYPSLFLTGDGRLFYSGSNSGYGSSTIGRQPGLWDLSNNTFQDIAGLIDHTMTETSTTVMLPPAQDQKFMIMGGGGVGDSSQATSRTAIVDLTKPNPSYVPGPSLAAPTRYSGAVILPDDTVLQTGGSSGYRKDDLLISQIYNPKTNSFSQAASPIVGRNYHSESLLLPDGRVAAFGSNPIDNTFELRIEVYSPAYLFKKTQRPKITNGPVEYTRGNTYNMQVKSAGPIKTAKLIRPSAVTHSTDIEQRSVNLDLKVTPGAIEVTVPDNANLLPADWYMLFVTDQNDVPSIARWVRVM